MKLASFQTISYANGSIIILDQTQLPIKEVYLKCDSIEMVWQAIKQLSVRGAPLIGISAAFGLCVGLYPFRKDSADVIRKKCYELSEYLKTSRPTAVNLFWALERMNSVLDQTFDVSGELMFQALEREAQMIFDEDEMLCRQMGENGADLINDADTILTHCNAGGLATSGYGTALAVIYTAHEQGKNIKVFADETRPLLQGSRLTIWELQARGIDVTLQCDSMAASLMAKGKIDKIIVGADRIAKNGDVANKIGTYSLAVLAHYHQIPFYVVAPYSTFDFKIQTGNAIPIEERASIEVSHTGLQQTAPHNTKVFNPAFDVTPNGLLSGIVTERGVLYPPFETALNSFRQELVK